MKSLQRPILDPCIYGEEHFDVEYSLEEESTNVLEYCTSFVNSKSFNLEEDEEATAAAHHLRTPSLDDKMPFLQMLRSTPPFTEPAASSFQVLLRLQHQKKPLHKTHNYLPEMMETTASSPVKAVLEPESCLTHDLLDGHSPVRSEKKELDNQYVYPHYSTYNLSSECNQEQPNSVEDCSRHGTSEQSPAQTRPAENRLGLSPTVNNRERRKRKRTRPPKDKVEVENKRMTHIAVERNRRRQMNDHLSALRALMHPSYVQRGDQASIIGGAIDFVKELEQLLQSLQANKKMAIDKLEETSAETVVSLPLNTYNMYTSLPLHYGLHEMEEIRAEGIIGGEEGGQERSGVGEHFRSESNSAAAEVQVTVIQNHANLKIDCERRPGQLLRAILALEELRLTVLHLNITTTTLQDTSSVHYSFSLKIEDDCTVGSADAIAGAVHHIFSFIIAC